MQTVNALYRGWKSIELRNDLVQVNVVPQLGGRVLNYQLGGHAFLWVNPLLAGQLPPASGLAPDGSWLNWGGDKLWVAPQGWDSNEKWAGPPDPILDGGPYRAEILTESDNDAVVKLTSASDPRTGMQLSRVLRLKKQSSHLNIVAAMTNISDAPKRWGIWSVTQLDAGSRSGTGWNPDLRTFVPVNRESFYAEGYRVLYGDSKNPQFRVTDGLFCAKYERIVGKVGLDSDAGWIATVDGMSGNVFVQRASYESDAEYPDGASVEVWTNGLGSLTAYGRTEQMSEDPGVNPYVLESELLSPFAQLAPGESAKFTYDWYATNIGMKNEGSYPVLGCSIVGCIAEPFTVSHDGQMSGHFGVFYEGFVMMEFLEAEKTHSSPPINLGSVSPSRPLILNGHVCVPKTARSAVLALYGSDGSRAGELAEVLISIREI